VQNSSTAVLEVALLVVVLAEQEVELVAHLLERGLIELGAVVLTDLLEDARRVGSWRDSDASHLRVAL
jgi:hypothetical protein